MKRKKDDGHGSIVPFSRMHKLLGFRLLGHPTDPNVGALEIRGDGGATTYLITQRELEELGTALNSLAAKMSRPDTGSVPLDEDTFHFGESDAHPEPDPLRYEH
jgi:hypothetical protein